MHLTATVNNVTAHDWTGWLIRDSSGEIGSDRKVVAGQTTTLELTRETAISREGNVTVRLVRELEGRGYTVERQFLVEGKACFGNVCEPKPTPTPTPAATTAASAAGARLPQWPWFEVCGDPTADES